MAGQRAKEQAGQSAQSAGEARASAQAKPAAQAIGKASISSQARPAGASERGVAGRKDAARPDAARPDAGRKAKAALPGAARPRAGGLARALVESPAAELLAEAGRAEAGRAEAGGRERGSKAGLKSVVLQPMSSFGKHLAMRPHGRAVQQEIDSLLRSMPMESVLIIDFEGVEMMDYSFADEALGAIFSRLSAKEYPNRYIVLAAGEGDLAEALIENVEVALARREVAALVLPKDGIENANEAATVAEKKSGAMPVVLKADAGEWRVAGTLPQHLIETLRAVMDRQQVTVRELADELQIDSATACNNRIARLYQLRLVRREAAIVPEGGRQYFYSSVI